MIGKLWGVLAALVVGVMGVLGVSALLERRRGKAQAAVETARELQAAELEAAIARGNMETEKARESAQEAIDDDDRDLVDMHDALDKRGR